MEISKQELEQAVQKAVATAIKSLENPVVNNDLLNRATVNPTENPLCTAWGSVAVVNPPFGTPGDSTPAVNPAGNNPTVNPVGNPPKKSAYQKTESLLYHYKGFQRIVEERQEEILQLQERGVPKRSKSIVQWSGGGNPAHDIVLPAEEIESAIESVQASVQKILRVLGMIDRGMAALADDPYYHILEKRYFDRLSQEQTALEFGVSQVTISNNQRRLVKALAAYLFPAETLDEIMN